MHNMLNAGRGNQKLSSLKVGQLVKGTVKRHMGSGLILTRMKGQTLLASTNLGVRVGDELLLKVKRLRPKPKLQVLEILSSATSSGKLTGTHKAFQQLWSKELPITAGLWNALMQSGENRGNTELIRVMQDQPDLWRRLLWNIAFNSTRTAGEAHQWVKNAPKIFTVQMIGQIHHHFAAPHSGPVDVNTLSRAIARFAEWCRGLDPAAAAWKGLLKAHHLRWRTMRLLEWEGGYWYGGLFPSRYGDLPALNALSVWTPVGERSPERPKRLALLALFRNEWILHGVVEYRKQDVVGTLDVNSPEFEAALESETEQFRSALSGHGYRDINLWVHCDPSIGITYEGLIPEGPKTLQYVG